MAAADRVPTYVGRVLGCVFAVVLATVSASYAAGYFFLFDDFALLGYAHRFDVPGILTQPLFGFFRPLPFLLTRLLFTVFSWQTPWLYAGVGLIAHLVNAVLVALIARRISFGRGAAIAAACTFLLSAPAAESYFWYSGIFDRMAACGTLAAILAGFSCLDAPRRTRALLFGAVGILSTTAGLMSKETCVVLPVLALATLLIRPGRLPLWRTAAYILSLGVGSVVFLAYRTRVLPGLSGAYGDWTALIAHASLLRNAGTYARALVVIPLPRLEVSTPVQWIVGAAPWVLSAGWAIVCGRLMRHRPRLIVWCATAAAVSIVPVLWTEAVPGSSASGRFVYVPGVWLALLVGAVLDLNGGLIATRHRIVAGITMALFGLAIGYQCASVVYQARIWSLASQLSRVTVSQVGQHKGNSSEGMRLRQQ
jgi:hypothetical protein